MYLQDLLKIQSVIAKPHLSMLFTVQLHLELCCSEFQFLYGITGSTNLFEINSVLKFPNVPEITFLISVIMIFAGIGFKISIVPFHFWTPDVYEGAPISITAFLSVASKAAGFAVLIRFIKITFAESLSKAGYWQIIILY